jgi:ABC-2 type transport system ATP-binding protein
LIHNPKVIILDEPTIGLDPAQIVEIRQLIKSFKGEHTVMLSTHILAEVKEVCDGVVIINEGKLMASGSLDELAQSFSQNDGIFLRLDKTDPEIQDLFKQLPGIKKVELNGSEIRLEWPWGQNLRTLIIKTCLDNHLEIREMRSVAMNIEELYLRIVSGGMEQ